MDKNKLIAEDIIKYGTKDEIKFLLEIHNPNILEIKLAPIERNELDTKESNFNVGGLKEILSKSEKIPNEDWDSNKFITFYIPGYYIGEIKDLMKDIDVWDIYSEQLADKLEKLLIGG